MAEREGFEPPIDLRLCLISSQVHSAGLCHLSALDYSNLYLTCDDSLRTAEEVVMRFSDGLMTQLLLGKR
jgi:hypothetical protein